MRRMDRQVTDLAQVQGIVSRCMVMRLAMISEGRPYIVPMNFAPLWTGDQLTLYAHSALKGMKIDALRHNSAVCVEMDCDGALITNHAVCQYGYQYSSLIGWGEAHIVQDVAEARLGLEALMRHQTGRDLPVDADKTHGVLVLRIVLTSWTAKACK